MNDTKIVRKALPERRPVHGQRLGRHVLHDPRSKHHRANEAVRVRSVQHDAVGLPLNQGKLGSCTANALCGALDSEPFNKGGRRFRQREAVRLYEMETALEGKPHPPHDPGGSGLMVCKAAKKLGWITGYTHAFGLDHALRALTLRPVITGVNWYESFYEPDANGLVKIHPHAKVEGGHEFLADGIDVHNQLVWFWNSWGRSFGVDGRFCMSFHTWERLLRERGDVTVPIL
jgi:hypothetical protein